MNRYPLDSKGETENMFPTPPSSPPPFPSFVENTSLRYNYIKEEKPPSPDPYGIGLENGNNFMPLPINVSCDIPLLNLHKIYFDLSSPPRSGEGTSSAARVATAMNGGAVVRAPFQSSKNTVRRTASSVNTGIAATIIHQPFHFMEMDNVRATPIVVPSSWPNNTYSGNVAVTVAPPPVPQIELEAPLVPFPYPNSKQGASQRPFEASTILVKRNKNIVRKLVKFAQKQGFLILGAAGIVSFVELFNDEDAPVAKTTLHGTFEIILLDGCIIIPKNNSSKREFSWLTILMAGKDSRIKGGPVKRLVAGSNVEIVVAPVSAFAAESMARQQYLRRPELAHFPNHRDREWLTKEIVNHIHKATLKEINNLA